MDTTLATPPPASVTPSPVQSETPPEPAVSIADHAEQFGPEKREREPANTGQFAHRAEDAKHRAQSQRATPEDVAEINRLTKELRELETKHADKDPHAKASPRIRTLQRQIAALRALEAPAPVTETPKTPTVEAPKAATTFEDKEPELADYADKDDPAKEWMKAWNRWDRKREEHEAQQQTTQFEHAKAFEDVKADYQKHAIAFAQTHPDFDAVVKAQTISLTPVLHAALLTAGDKGPAYVYHLAQHPELRDDLLYETDGKQLTDANVAAVQRRLQNALGSAQAVLEPDRPPKTPPYSPPKPPNPVRTGSIKTADDPPGEAASIRDHAKYYGPKAR